MKQAFWAICILLLSGISFAQSDPVIDNESHRGAGVTYHMPPGNGFVCDAASQYPVKYFSQFTCRGIPLVDSTGKPVGQFFLFNPNEINLVLPPFVSDPYQSYTYGYPNGALPANFAFDYVAVEFEHNNIIRRGIAHVTWKNDHVCGGKSCWWHPELTAFSITVH